MTGSGSACNRPEVPPRRAVCHTSGRLSLPAVEPPQINDNPQEQRYEAWMGDELAGFAQYRIAGTRVIFFHTKVEPAFEGKGVGARLAAAALDDVRARGMRMTPRCPFIAAYVRRHPEYADLVWSPPPRDA